MSKGYWSFIHEWAIYDYLQTRTEEGTLKLKKVISDGSIVGRTKWCKVQYLKPIINTCFPDIQGINFYKNDGFFPAEVKFTTSLFNYHKDSKYLSRYKTFQEQNGIIIVLSHDYLPSQLVNSYSKVNVYEIDLQDFITFCRENFTRLLNRQIKCHINTRVWLMYQGPNFNKGSQFVLPARESLIWCPTENLTGFDLAPGDKIIFYKTSGSSTFEVQKTYLKSKDIIDSWYLTELYLAEVTSKIYSRIEFCQHYHLLNNTILWCNDPYVNDEWRWKRVFEFKKINTMKLHIRMSDLYQYYSMKNFTLLALEAFCFGKSREISLKDYQSLLEQLLSHSNN